MESAGVALRGLFIINPEVVQEGGQTKRDVQAVHVIPSSDDRLN